MKTKVYITNQKKLAQIMGIWEHHLSNCINHAGFFRKKVLVVHELTGIPKKLIESAGKPHSDFPVKLAEFFESQMKLEEEEMARITEKVLAKVSK